MFIHLKIVVFKFFTYNMPSVEYCCCDRWSLTYVWLIEEWSLQHGNVCKFENFQKIFRNFQKLVFGNINGSVFFSILNSVMRIVVYKSLFWTSNIFKSCKFQFASFHSVCVMLLFYQVITKVSYILKKRKKKNSHLISSRCFICNFALRRSFVIR